MTTEQQLSHSYWLKGAEAARKGESSMHCPFGPDSYNFVVWHNGWSCTKHEMTKDAARKAVLNQTPRQPAKPQYDLDDV